MVDIMKRDWVGERWEFVRDNYSKGFSTKISPRGGGSAIIKNDIVVALELLHENKRAIDEIIQSGDFTGWPYTDVAAGGTFTERETKEHAANLGAVIDYLEKKTAKP